jgi:hypothetical protein
VGSVPLAISSVKTIVQIVLELALVSKIHVKSFNPTVKTQATIRLVCEYVQIKITALITSSLLGAAVGVAFFLLILCRKAHGMIKVRSSWLSLSVFHELVRPGKYTFLESAIRNAI